LYGLRRQELAGRDERKGTPLVVPFLLFARLRGGGLIDGLQLIVKFQM
jgi:hypothetical protein